MDKINQLEKNDLYVDTIYQRRQVRDVVAGSDRVKRSQEMYLPMPSGMSQLDVGASSTQRTGNFSNNNIDITNYPWYHRNQAYMAYLQRARFSDITANIMVGLLGVAMDKDPDYKLSPQTSQFEERATRCGKSLIKLFEHSLSEVMQTSKICFIVDMDSGTNKPIIVPYSAERNTDWNYSDGELVRCVFAEYETDEEIVEIEYKLIPESDKENAKFYAGFQRYKNGTEFGDPEFLEWQGKKIEFLPIVFASSVENNASPERIPLYGISDIALTMYRNDADIAQAKFMTCNPTLFLFGIPEHEKPEMIGSIVTVCVSNPQASANYPKTDTSALQMCSDDQQQLREEAIYFGAQMLGSGKKGVESVEALNKRETGNGYSLITIVSNVSTAFNKIFEIISKWGGGPASEFEANVDFASHDLTAQELTAMLSAYTQGGISHDTFLDNIRNAKILSDNITNEKEKERIRIDDENRMNWFDQQSNQNTSQGDDQ